MYNRLMKFPRDLLRFICLIFFKPVTLHAQIGRLDPAMANAAAMLTRPHDRSAGHLKALALFHVLISPGLVGFGTGMLCSQLGLEVNWFKLSLYLFIAIALSVNFRVEFCIAFLLPFSAAVAVWSSTPFTLTMGALFSLSLGLAYGLNPKGAGWGLAAGLVYGVLFGLVQGPSGGLAIGAAFLTGYFRIPFYLPQALLSWILGTLALRGEAFGLWRFNPVVWDELIWFPLPRLDLHLMALRRQNEAAAEAAVLHVRESFRQGWAARLYRTHPGGQAGGSL